MHFASQGDAKRFFVERIASHAQAERAPLSKAEKWMLAWSESDPSFTPDPGLIAQFEKETTNQEFERKISGLIKRAYTKDVKSDSAARMRYQEAYRLLNEGDHYIQIMIESAIAWQLGLWKIGLLRFLGG